MPHYRDIVQIKHKNVSIYYDEDDNVWIGGKLKNASLKNLKAAIDREQRTKYKELPCFVKFDNAYHKGVITSIKYGEIRVRYVDEKGRTKNERLNSYNAESLIKDTSANRKLIDKLEPLLIAYEDIANDIQAIENRLERQELKLEVDEILDEDGNANDT